MNKKDLTKSAGQSPSDTKPQITISVWQTECGLCKKKFKGMTKEEVEKIRNEHVKNDCKVAQTLIEWDKKGITQDMVKFYEMDALETKLKKLIKEYTFEKVKDMLDSLEGEFDE